MGEVTGVCLRVGDWLSGQGVRCAFGWPGSERGRLCEPVVSVQLKEYGINDSGQINYLGERYDEERANWVECYGRKVDLVLALVVYAPETTSGEELQRVVDRLTGAFSRSAPEGTKVNQITCGPTCWDREQGCLKRETAVELTAWLVAQADEHAEFLDFELRGGWKI